MLRIVAAVGVGYVLGAKAGRRRFEQINKAYQAVTSSPASKKVVDFGRRKLSEKIHPQPQLRAVKTIDETTTVYAPLDPRD